jgi:hypothetical protein
VLDPRLLKNEGFNLILPWNEVFQYDLRLQSFTESYNAISRRSPTTPSPATA